MAPIRIFFRSSLDSMPMILSYALLLIHRCGQTFQDACSASVSLVEASGGAPSSALVSASATPMRLANQRVSGKVSNITATNRVIGSARNAPGPPSNQAQMMKDKKTTVGEM